MRILLKALLELVCFPGYPDIIDPVFRAQMISLPVYFNPSGCSITPGIVPLLLCALISCSICSFVCVCRMHLWDLNLSNSKVI